MKKPKFTFVKYLMLMSISISAIVISGCGKTQLNAFFSNDIVAAIKDRAELNKTYASKFHDIGAISDSELDKVISQIDTQMHTILGDEGGEPNYQHIMSNIATAVSHYRVLDMDTVGTLHATDDNEADVVLCHRSDNTYKMHVDSGAHHLDDVACTNNDNKAKSNVDADGVKNLPLAAFSAGNYIGANVYGEYGVGGHTVEEENIDPIPFFTNLDDPESLAGQLNKALHARVYILKPNILEASGSNSIDGVLELVQQALSADVKEQVGLLNNYFIPAYDQNNKPVYLIDNDAADVEDYNMIITSRESSSHEARLGYDLVIDQNFGAGACNSKGQLQKDMIRLRFNEFNQDALDKIEELTELDAYVLAKDPNSGWKAYYMIYPIEVIRKIVDEGDKTVSFETSKSGLGLNIKTNKYVKYEKLKGDENYDYSKYEAVPEDAEYPYYFKLESANNNNADGLAPMVVDGYSTEYAIKQFLPNETHKDKPPKCTVARLVMSDYLEGTFAPGFVEGESVVFFGRKLRLNMNKDYWQEMEGEEITWFDGTETKVKLQTHLIHEKDTNGGVAYYVDGEGNRIESMQTLQVTDFADAKELRSAGSNHTMKTIVTNEMSTATIPATTKDGEDETATSIKKQYVDTYIEPSVRMPSAFIDNIDFQKADQSELQLMYGLTTRFGLFDNALFSQWINSQSQKASLAYWNDYLGHTKFDYDVGTEHVLAVLEDKYAYELSQSGIIILDLETVAKIQKQYDEEESDKRTSLIRTFFMLLGWAIISYSALLMIAWLIDANMDIGVKLLEKMTFGNWVAVKYEDDIPYKNVNDQTFLDSKKMFIRCIIMIALGIFLINANIFNVVLTLIDLFGRAASKIEDVIQGYK